MANSLGKQMLVEFYNCSPENLNDENLLKEVMEVAAVTAGATVINSTFHSFSPYGITGVVIVAESHLSIHTWPEYGYAAVDIFTCGDLIDNSKALVYIQEQISSEYYSVVEMRRGILHNRGEIKHKAGA